MSFWRLLSAVLVSNFLIAGCSNVKDELKPAQLEALEVEYTFSPQWQVDAGRGQDARYARLQPVLSDGTIYTLGVGGRIHSVQAESGKVNWSQRFKVTLGGGLGTANDLLFAGTLDGEVLAIAKADGELKWRAQVSSEVISSPQSDGDVVVVQAIDGRVFALDVADGSQRWSYDHPMPVLSLRANASPLMVDDATFIGFDNGQLLKFDSASGQLRWSARVGQPRGKTEIERLVDVDSNPIASGPFIYAAGYSGRLVAINRGTGRINWAQDLSTYHHMTAKDELIIVTDSTGHVRAFEMATGTLAWENAQLHRRGVSAPGSFGPLVLVVDDSGILHGLELATGRLVARRRVPEAMFAQPLSDQQRFYLYTEDGRLTAYSLKKLDKPRTTTITDERHPPRASSKPVGASRLR